METQQGKPKVSYADFIATQKRPNFKIGTVAWLIQRFINEMNGWDGKPPVRELGGSHEYILRRLQREPIGEKCASKLTKHDVIEHCKERIKAVCPATINQDITYLTGVLKYAPSAWDDCEDISDAAISAARPFLVKHAYIGKSVPRTRVPTDGEIEQLQQGRKGA